VNAVRSDTRTFNPPRKETGALVTQSRPAVTLAADSPAALDSCRHSRNSSGPSDGRNCPEPRGLAATENLKVRSIFISDLHLGSRFARADSLLAFLEGHQPDYLYLVGDIVDGWCLRRKWHWPETYNRLLDRLLELAREGTQIRLTPGNHDEFLRRFLLSHHLVMIEDEFIHEGPDQRRVVVLHGDRFDSVETQARWLSLVGNVGYEVLLRIDHYANRLLQRLGRPRRRISQAVKGKVKRIVQFVSQFEDRLREHAHLKGCQAVICGHIHMPEVSRRDGLLYVNLGDWVENGTALIEYHDGRLELLDTDRSRSLAQVNPLATGPLDTNAVDTGTVDTGRLNSKQRATINATVGETSLQPAEPKIVQTGIELDSKNVEQSQKRFSNASVA